MCLVVLSHVVMHSYNNARECPLLLHKRRACSCRHFRQKSKWAGDEASKRKTTDQVIVFFFDNANAISTHHSPGHSILISRLRERYKVCVIINFCNSTENNRTERRTNEKCQRKNDVGDHTDFDNYKWLCRGHTRLDHTLLAPLCLRHCLSFIYS